MKLLKSFLAISVLASITSFAHADDKTSSNNFFGGVSVGSFDVNNSDEKSSTAYGVFGGYRHYLDDKFSTDASLAYFGTSNENGDKLFIPSVGIAYDYKFSNGVVVRPKAGIGYYYDKFNDGSDSNTAYRVGLEFEINKNLSAGIDYTRLTTKNNYASLITTNLSYKF